MGAGTWTLFWVMPWYCQHHLLESLPFGPPLLRSWNLPVSLPPTTVQGQSLPLLKVWRKMSKVQDHLRAGVTLHQNCSVTVSARQALKEKKIALIFPITCAWNALLSAFTCRILLVLQRAAKKWPPPGSLPVVCLSWWLLSVLWASPESQSFL